MTQFIQKFIEKNIELIENNEWNEVFLNWYNDAEDLWPDEGDEFGQFIKILQGANIDPDLDAASSVLYNIISDMMIVEKNTFLQTKHISIFSVVNKLDSRLGNTSEDILKIMNDIATKLGMHYTEFYGGGFSW